nr:hypothetical protein [Candidatus Njordarchaeota archaeon]
MGRFVESEEEYGEIISDYKSPLSNSKEAKVEAVLRCFNEEPKVLGATSSLLATAKSRLDVEELNRYLIRDGYEYDSEKKQIIPSTGHPEIEAKILSELESRLANLGDEFPPIHSGVWDAISSGTEDSLRQAVSSSRELLSQVVRKLTSQLSDNPTRKSRIKAILQSKSQADVIDSVANLVNAIYSSQSGGVHSESSLDTTIMVAKLTEYCLLFILRKTQGTP